MKFFLREMIWFMLISIYIYANSAENINLSKVSVETGNDGIIQQIRLSDNEKYLLSVDERSVVIYDIKTRKQLKKIIIKQEIKDFILLGNNLFLLSKSKIIIYNIISGDKKTIELLNDFMHISKVDGNLIMIYRYGEIALIDKNGKIKNKIITKNYPEKILKKIGDKLYYTSGGALFLLDLSNNNIKKIIKSIYDNKIITEYTDSCPDAVLDLKNNTYYVVFNYNNYGASGIVKYDLTGKIIFKKFFGGEIESVNLYKNKLYISKYFGDIEVLNAENGKKIISLIVNNQKTIPRYVGMSFSHLVISKSTHSIFVSSGKFIHQFGLDNKQHYVYGNKSPTICSAAYNDKNDVLYTIKHDSNNFFSLVSKWDLQSGIKLRSYGQQNSVVQDILYLDNKLLVLTYEKLFIQDEKNSTIRILKNAKPNYLSSIKTMSNNSVLLSTRLGLSKINIEKDKATMEYKDSDILDFSLSNNRHTIYYAKKGDHIYKIDVGTHAPKKLIPLKLYISDNTLLTLTNNDHYLIQSNGYCSISIYDLVKDDLYIHNRKLCQDISSITGIIMTSEKKDDHKILVGTYGHGVFVYDFVRGKVTKKINSELMYCTKIKRINEKYIVATFTNGAVKIIDNNFNVVATLYEFPSRDWLTITPEGYFTGSKDAAKYLNITKYTKDGMEPFDFSQLYDHFFRPDLVKLKLSGNEEAYQKAIGNMTYQEALKNPPPKISFISVNGKRLKKSGIDYDVVKTDKNKVKITFNIDAQQGGVGLVRIYQEGKLVKTIGNGQIHRQSANLDTLLEQDQLNHKAREKQKEYLASLAKAIDRNISLNDAISKVTEKTATKNKAGKYTVEIALKSGKNEISIEAFNKTNTVTSYRESLTINASIPKHKPKLYAIVAGVNDFEAPWASHLKYSVNDARAIKALAEKNINKVFDSVEVKYLANTEVTKSHIYQAIKEISKKAKLEDTILFFISTHGKAYKGRLFLVPHNNKNIANLINFKELFGAIQSIKALNQIFVIDACESGEANDIVSSVYDSRASVLAKSSGVHLLLATTRGTSAFESQDPNIKHSLFTYRILKTLKDKHTDLNKDHFISILELSKRLKQTTKNNTYQYPVIRNVGRDVKVERVE